MEVFGISWDELKQSSPWERQKFNKKGPSRNRGKMTRGRGGKDGGNITGHGKRFVDEDIIDKWDEAAMEKLKNMTNEKEKAEV